MGGNRQKGGNPVKRIERFHERDYPFNDVKSSLLS